MEHVVAGGSFGLLLAQTLAIVISSRLIGLVARRFGQPMVIAEIIAGMGRDGMWIETTSGCANRKTTITATKNRCTVIEVPKPLRAWFSCVSTNRRSLNQSRPPQREMVASPSA